MKINKLVLISLIMLLAVSAAAVAQLKFPYYQGYINDFADLIDSENLARLKVTKPEALDKIKVIWSSPIIPSDPIVWRKDLSDDDKTKLKAFFLGYGTERAGFTAEQVAAEKAILAGLQWSNFKASTDDQLIPIRQLDLFKKKSKIMADDSLSADEKAKQVAEIDEKLKALEAKAKTN